MEANLRCSGHIHKVGITAKGDIVFFHHTLQEIRNEAILEKITGMPSTCQCYNFLKDYKNVIKRDLRHYFGRHTQVYKKIFMSNYVKAAQWKSLKRRYNSSPIMQNFIFAKYMSKKAGEELYITFDVFLLNNKGKKPNIEYKIAKIVNIDVPESFYYESKHSNTPQIFWTCEKWDYGKEKQIEWYSFTIHYSYKWHIIYKKFYGILKDFFIISIKEQINPEAYIVSGLYIDEKGEPIISDAKIEKTQNGWQIQLLSKDLST